MSYGLNPYTMVIVILIVLQWFRVGENGRDGVTPEHGLLNNGGLFIIAIFLLVYCSCVRRLYFPTAVSPANY